MSHNDGRVEALHQARRALFERLGWDVAERDDARVARAVANREELDDIYGLDQAGLLDGFMGFLREIHFLDHLERLTPERRQRFMVPASLILLTYMTKTLLGIEHVYAMPDLLFTDTGVMKLLGFNAQWMEEGLCQRSHEKRGADQPPPKPFSAQMVANFLADLTVKESVELFNAAIRCLASADFFPSELTVIIDGSDVETTAKCDGAGRVLREKKVGNRYGRVQIVTVEVHGFKVVVAFELATQIPVALIVTKIQFPENLCTRRLIRQVQANLSDTPSRITKVLVDRGFLDGSDLWWLDQQGIDFVVPARTNLKIAKVARLEADHGHEERRVDKEVHGRGKTRRVEEKETVVVGVEELPFLDSFNDPEKVAHAHRRGYKPKPLQAVVVRTYEGHRYEPRSEPVFLTNMQVRRPLTVYNQYRHRSLIENTLFREGKQAWALENLPQKNQRATVAHLAITFLMVALTTAYRIQCEQTHDDEDPTPAETLVNRLGAPVDDTPVGVRRWRRQLQKRNKDYVMVFCEGVYGIFHVAAFTVLAGFRVKTMPETLGTREAIFARYGLQPPP